MIRNEEVIAKILEYSEIKEGIDVLDVACGTGVLFPDYQKRKVASLTGIDISKEMCKIAKAKYPDVDVICADVETYVFDKKFDVIVVYNAFPHFAHPAHVIEVLSKHLKPQGRLSIAHGMSRIALLKHHEGRAAHVSIALLEENELAKVMEPYFDVDVIISNETMYQVAGKRKR